MEDFELGSIESVIVFALIIIASYLFNLISKKTNIPSVLLLIVLGIALQAALPALGLDKDSFFPVLEVLGIVGLIMIVLEAALELEITKDKWPIIWKSFSVALLALLASSALIGLLIWGFVIDDFYTALVYAVPLSIMSSAIIIPSVGRLAPDKKEFMVYESTFSDILGIMLFYFLIGEADAETVGEVVWSVAGNIFVTIALSLVVGYGLIWLFQRITTPVKFFLLIAVLILMYALGKLFHLSSLIIILMFGLILSNYKLTFRGFLKKLIDEEKIPKILHELHTVTLETAFVVRTFFFVIFGIVIALGSLASIKVAGISLLIVAVLYGVRLLFLKIFRWNQPIFPELWIAPRGLITVLLFFAIPEPFKVEDFDFGLLLYPILITSMIMTVGLIMDARKAGLEAEAELADDGEGPMEAIEAEPQEPEAIPEAVVEEVAPPESEPEPEEPAFNTTRTPHPDAIKLGEEAESEEPETVLVDQEGNEVEPYFEVIDTPDDENPMENPIHEPEWEDVIPHEEQTGSGDDHETLEDME